MLGNYTKVYGHKLIFVHDCLTHKMQT